ncbi:MAG: hypothetical protein SA339_07095 [Methanomassiliicoccus sp.]|nr:hypothetical protein [Methanomassiliicoccus sp.]
MDKASGIRKGENMWDGRCIDPSLRMFRKAVDYALAKGLAWDDMPELRSENGVMHAIRPSGKKLRLEDKPGWEHQSGYAKLVNEMVAMRRVYQTTIEDFVSTTPLRGTAKT